MLTIINEKKEYGGTEVFVARLRRILDRNNIQNKIIYISAENVDYTEGEISLNCNSGILGKFIIYPNIVKKLRTSIKDNSVVVVNNVFSSPISIYISLLFTKAIQIVHDYSIVCPKSTCVRDDGSICNGYKFEYCLLKCTYQNSKLYLLAKLVLTYISGWLRKKAIKQFISPSAKLAEYASKNGFRCTSIPNPVSLSIEEKHNFDGKEHHYIYIGGLNENKGLYDMLPAFYKFSLNRNNVYLDIYGKPVTTDDELFIKSYVSSKIKYHGSVSHEKINAILKNGYALLVPSKWMENYPTTVLEGFASRLLVIGSSRGGIPELLESNRGICYQYGRNTLSKALEKAEALSSQEYQSITDNGIKYILENNTDKAYFQRIKKYLQ